MQPEEWGWKVFNGKLLPVMMDQSPAPENILRIIRCNCHADCSTTRCTCRVVNVEVLAAQIEHDLHLSLKKTMSWMKVKKMNNNCKPFIFSVLRFIWEYLRINVNKINI